MRGGLLLLLAASAARAGVVVNEVSFDGPPGVPDWVELYNAGPAPVSIDGWTLSDEDAAAGNEVTISLSTPVPAGGFLVVHIDAAGTDETDFSDGRGELYSGTATTVALAATEDELALRSPGGMEDFVAWATDGVYDGAADQAAAVAAGLWSAGDVVALADPGDGYSLVRAVDGADGDLSSDFWGPALPTPGAPNAPPPRPGDAAAPREAVINEVAWGGTAASSTHEWIELLNAGTRTLSLDGWRLTNADGDLDVPLSGLLAPGAYLLLERTSDQTVSDAPAGAVYSGSLSNGGEDLTLLDVSSAVVDAARFARSGWPAGSGSPEFRSMERAAPSADGDLWVNWVSNDGSARNGLDARGAPLNGTPGARNAAHSPVLPGPAGTSSRPPPSGVLTVDPAANPFSPRDPDPARRAARFSFDAGAPEAVKTLRVTDVRGEVVRAFSDGNGLPAAPAGEVAWDGADADGRWLPPGVYVVHFEAVDPATGSRRAAKATVVLGYPR